MGVAITAVAREHANRRDGGTAVAFRPTRAALACPMLLEQAIDTAPHQLTQQEIGLTAASSTTWRQLPPAESA